jgi:hypothetical protein
MFLAAAAVTVFVGATPAQERRPMSNSQPLVMTRYTICDVARNNNAPVGTMLVPQGWRAESYVRWTLKTAQFPVEVHSRFTSPDGAAAVEFFPVVVGSLNSSNMGVQSQAPPADAVAAMRQLAQTARPNARFRVLDSAAAPSQRQASGYGGTVHQTGRLKVAYEENGQSFEEEFAGTLTVQVTGTGGFETRTWYIHSSRGIRAAGGRFAQVYPVGVAMARSGRATPEFQKAMDVAAECVRNIFVHRMTCEQIEQQAYLRALHESNAQWQQVCEDRWRSQDRQNEQMRDILGGVNRFVDNSGRDVTLPVTHTHAWDNGNGLYVLTNDPSYRPDADFTGTWNQLRPKY